MKLWCARVFGLGLFVVVVVKILGFWCGSLDVDYILRVKF